MDDAPRILGGRYEVGELIGRGGMAEVHIGHDTRLGRTVAIKILRSDLARDPSFQARFRREAQAAAALNHPAIVAVYDTGEDVSVEPNGTVAHVPFIVMEYVEGHTVRDILHDGAAVPIEEAVEITAGVLSALEYSHHAGIVHRDIKPANVMLTPTGAVKVMDFGIARAMADAAGTMTQTQAVIGTAQYLSPEQARGEQVDSRSDLYSTGCLLFELLTGRPPFVGDSPVAVAYQHARENPQPPSTFASDVPEPLDRITMKALAKDRDQRYSSAADFRGDLEAALRGGYISAPAVGALGVLGGAAAAGAAATAQYDTPAAATQVMRPSPPPVAPAPPSPGWAPLGVEDTGTSSGGPDDDEERGRRTWVVWLLIGVAVAAIVGIILLLTRDPGGEELTPVLVPDVVGMTEDEARDAIEGVDLEFQRMAEASTEEEGRVTRTDPVADTEVEPGSAVQVWISSGPDAVTVPEMANFTQEQALAALIDAGFDAANVRWDTDDHVTVLEGSVIRTEPPAGESVPPSSEITVFTSTGRVALPDLVNATEQDARTRLSELRLIPDVTYEDSDQTPGTVLRQNPSQGSVPQGSTVQLVVAQAPVIEQVQVPDVTGRTYGQAAAQLGAANLNAQPGEERYSETVEAGRVIETNPAAGALVDEGSTVTVILSLGPEDPPEESPGEQSPTTP